MWMNLGKLQGASSQGRKEQREICKKKNFFLLPFFVWPNNQIDVRQVNRRKTNLISYVWESKGMKLSYSQQLRLICHSELKEGAGESGASNGRKIHPRDIGRTNIW